MWYIIWTKGKTKPIWSFYFCRRNTWWNSTSIHDKNSYQSIVRTYFNIIKVIVDKPITNIILKSEKPKAFSLYSGARQEYSLSWLLFNIVSSIKDTQIERKEVKLSLYADNMILYIENPKYYTQKQLEPVNEFRKVTGYKASIQKFLPLFTLTIPFKIMSKN